MVLNLAVLCLIYPHWSTHIPEHIYNLPVHGIEYAHTSQARRGNQIFLQVIVEGIENIRMPVFLRLSCTLFRGLKHP